MHMSLMHNINNHPPINQAHGRMLHSFRTMYNMYRKYTSLLSKDLDKL